MMLQVLLERRLYYLHSKHITVFVRDCILTYCNIIYVSYNILHSKKKKLHHKILGLGQPLLYTF